MDIESPQQRFRLVLLIIVVVLIIMTLAGRSINRMVGHMFHRVGGLIPPSTWTSVLRPELIVLLLAAVILIYLIFPGIEIKITGILTKLLSFFGVQVSRGRRHD